MLKLVCQRCKKAWYTSEGVSQDDKSDCCGAEFEYDELLSNNEKEYKIKRMIPALESNIGVVRV